jgi:serine/threonine-protein kinase
MTVDRTLAPGEGLTGGTLLADRYRIDTRIAAGGMGVVHRGWDQRLSRPVALKLLHAHLAAEAEVERRFRAEARHAARVKHPNVVILYDQDDHQGIPFIVMELITGHTLRDVLHDRGRLTPAEVLDIVEPACAGLSAIHATGLVHRDIKPENLLIDATGVVRVADFGIASALDATRHTPAGVLLGSVRYMAPEIVLGQTATPASDQYALGIVMFEALTGTAPLPADDPAALALRHAREPVPPPSSADPAVSSALDEVVMTATALEPGARYPGLDALVTAARAAARRPQAPRPPARSYPPMRGGLTPRTIRGATAAPHAAARHAPAGPAPAGPAPRPAMRPPPADPPPRRAAWPAVQRRAAARPRRQPLSVLAVTAAVLSLFDGVAGMFFAPLCGSLALRRIQRRDGELRGAWFAYLAIGVAAMRVLSYLATHAA